MIKQFLWLYHFIVFLFSFLSLIFFYIQSCLIPSNSTAVTCTVKKKTNKRERKKKSKIEFCAKDFCCSCCFSVQIRPYLSGRRVKGEQQNKNWDIQLSVFVVLPTVRNTFWGDGQRGGRIWQFSFLLSIFFLFLTGNDGFLTYFIDTYLFWHKKTMLMYHDEMIWLNGNSKVHPNWSALYFLLNLMCYWNIGT